MANRDMARSHELIPIPRMYKHFASHSDFEEPGRVWNENIGVFTNLLSDLPSML